MAQIRKRGDTNRINPTPANGNRQPMTKADLNYNLWYPFASELSVSLNLLHTRCFCPIPSMMKMEWKRQTKDKLNAFTQFFSVSASFSFLAKANAKNPIRNSYAGEIKLNQIQSSKHWVSFAAVEPFYCRNCFITILRASALTPAKTEIEICINKMFLHKEPYAIEVFYKIQKYGHKAGMPWTALTQQFHQIVHAFICNTNNPAANRKTN